MSKINLQMYRGWFFKHIQGNVAKFRESSFLPTEIRSIKKRNKAAAIRIHN